MKSNLRLTTVLSGIFLLAANLVHAQSNSPLALAFKAGTNGTFTFDTGVLRGVLRADGKSVGLQSVTHVPSGIRLDQSMGLFSHYRVFTTGRRYGGGAWDWPSTARLTPDGAAEVLWRATEERPFELRAIYRWATATALDLETSVTARQDLSKFESFLASYFTPGFTNELVLTQNESAPDGPPTFIRVQSASGNWQMFPRDDAAVSVIEDGRWKLPPNPVDWAIRPRFAKPVAVRRDLGSNLSALVLARSDECFALAMPHEAETHCSLYLCQFGRDFKSGETAHARARLVMLDSAEARRYLQEWVKFSGK